MGVWIVPEATVEQTAAKMSQHREVSHCYLRPVYADWPYNLYTIVHGRSVDECESIINDLAIDSGIDYGLRLLALESVELSNRSQKITQELKAAGLADSDDAGGFAFRWRAHQDHGDSENAA